MVVAPAGRRPNRPLRAAQVLLAIYLAVRLSILLHGITAAPPADSYGRWYQAHPRQARPSMEGAPAVVTRAR